MSDPAGPRRGRHDRAVPSRSGASWATRVRGYLALPHPLAVVLVEAATLGFALITWGGLPPIGWLTRLLLAMLGGQLAIGAVNELVDEPDDAVGKPHKPLPSGAVTPGGARVMAGAGLAIMAIAGGSLGPISLLLLLIGTGLGLAYDFWLKRTSWSWLPYMLALPLLPIWVFASLGRFTPELLLLYPLGALASVGVHFAQALPDVAIDREAGLANPTSRLGVTPAFAAAWWAALSAPLLAWLVAWHTGVPTSGILAVVVALAILLLAINLALLAHDAQRGVSACFPLIGAVALVSGLAWTYVIAG